jgi:hypothetical protein
MVGVEITPVAAARVLTLVETNPLVELAPSDTRLLWIAMRGEGDWRIWG